REIRGGDRGEPVDRPDGEVDPARDEDERACRGDDQRRRLLIEDVEHVVLRGKGLARQREREEEREERNENPAAPQEPHAGRAHLLARHPGTLRRGVRRHADTAEGSANAAARIRLSLIASPSSCSTMRPLRMTSTRWARPMSSSTSDEIRRI